LGYDARVLDLIRAGRVLVGMFPPQCTTEPVTGTLRGWPIDLGLALGARLGVGATSIEYPGPDKFLEGLDAGECDIGFLPDSPYWQVAVEFSHPFLELDFTFLAPANSPLRTVRAADRPGVRIAVVSHHASTLALTRMLKHATPVSTDTLDGAFDLLRDGNADLFASTRPQLIDDSKRLAGSTVLKDRYGVNLMALVAPKGRGERVAYMNDFLQAAKSSGLVQQAVERAGWQGVQMI